MSAQHVINLTNEEDLNRIVEQDQMVKCISKDETLKNKFSDEQIQHPLNEPLLEEAHRIKEERNTLKLRLQKLDENRSAVSGNVYQKVRKDYLTLLGKTTEKLLSLKKSLEDEQARILSKKVMVESRLSEHREAIEEAELRFSLGEFTEEQRTNAISEEKSESERLEKALQTLEENLDRHLQVLEGEDFVTEEALKKAPIQESPTPAFLEARKRMEIVPPPAPEESSESPDIPEVDEDIQEEIDNIIEEAPESMTPPPPLASPHETTQKTAPKKLSEDTPTPHALRLTDTTAQKKVPEIEVLQNGQVIQKLSVDKTIQIGRSPANDVVLNEPKVSRKHAEIQFAAGKYILLDLESSNGTFVGGKKVSEYTLQPGDEIIIGNTRMVFKN